jgi:hypothetical protein
MLTDGVPESAMILEKESTSSSENILMKMAAAREAGINPKSVILCAMSPLLRKLCAAFRKHFQKLLFTEALSMPLEWFTPKRVNRLLGKIQRLNEYAEKSDIAKVEIPDEILSATERIRQTES